MEVEGTELTLSITEAVARKLVIQSLFVKPSTSVKLMNHHTGQSVQRSAIIKRLAVASINRNGSKIKQTHRKRNMSIREFPSCNLTHSHYLTSEGRHLL